MERREKRSAPCEADETTAALAFRWPVESKSLVFFFSCLLPFTVFERAEPGQAGQPPLLLVRRSGGLLLLSYFLVRPIGDDTYSRPTTTCPGKHIVIRILPSFMRESELPDKGFSIFFFLLLYLEERGGSTHAP